MFNLQLRTLMYFSQQLDYGYYDVDFDPKDARSTAREGDRGSFNGDDMSPVVKRRLASRILNETGKGSRFLNIGKRFVHLDSNTRLLR